MGTHRVCTPLFLALALLGAAPAPSDAPSPPRLVVDLVDGSRIVGTADAGSITVAAAFGNAQFKLDQVAAIDVRDDHEVVQVRFRNGDKVTGVMTSWPFAVSTVFGPVKLKAEHVRRIELAGVPVIPPGLAKSLMLHYSFDVTDDRRVRDETSAKNDGVNHGATFCANGKSGGAIRFDGVDDYVDAGNPDSLQLTRDFTLGAWIRSDELKEGVAIMAKSFGYPEQDRRGIEFTLGPKGGLSAYFWDSSTQFFAGGTNDGVILWDKWHFVVLQHDSSLKEHQMRIFVDGVEQKLTFGYEATPSIPVVRNVKETWKIGCLRPGLHQFKGLIDDVMIFNRVLSEKEIRLLAAAP